MDPLAIAALQCLLGGTGACVTREQVSGVHEIAETALAIVEQAWLSDPHTGRQRPVCLKSLRPDVFTTRGGPHAQHRLREFIHQVARLHGLQHRHLLRLLGVGCYDPSTWHSLSSSLFTVEEYGGSMTLHRLIKAGQLCPEEDAFHYTYLDALRWMVQLADALAYLHENGIAHGDVRPTNLYFFLPDVHTNEIKLGDLKPHRSWYQHDLAAHGDARQHSHEHMHGILGLAKGAHSWLGRRSPTSACKPGASPALSAQDSGRPAHEREPGSAPVVLDGCGKPAAPGQSPHHAWQGEGTRSDLSTGSHDLGPGEWDDDLHVLLDQAANQGSRRLARSSWAAGAGPTLRLDPAHAPAIAHALHTHSAESACDAPGTGGSGGGGGGPHADSPPAAPHSVLLSLGLGQGHRHRNATTAGGVRTGSGRPAPWLRSTGHRMAEAAVAAASAKQHALESAVVWGGASDELGGVSDKGSVRGGAGGAPAALSRQPSTRPTLSVLPTGALDPDAAPCTAVGAASLHALGLDQPSGLGGMTRSVSSRPPACVPFPTTGGDHGGLQGAVDLRAKWPGAAHHHLPHHQAHGGGADRASFWGKPLSTLSQLSGLLRQHHAAMLSGLHLPHTAPTAHGTKPHFARATYTSHVNEQCMSAELLHLDTSDLAARSRHKAALQQQVEALGITPATLAAWTSTAGSTTGDSPTPSPPNGTYFDLSRLTTPASTLTPTASIGLPYYLPPSGALSIPRGGSSSTLGGGSPLGASPGGMGAGTGTPPVGVSTGGSGAHDSSGYGSPSGVVHLGAPPPTAATGGAPSVGHHGTAAQQQQQHQRSTPFGAFEHRGPRRSSSLKRAGSSRSAPGLKKSVTFAHEPARNKLAGGAHACYHAPPEALDTGCAAACCTPQGDVFAFALVLQAVFARDVQSPVGDTNREQWEDIQRRVTDTAKGVRPSLPEHLPASLKKLIAACWAQSPEQRPSMSAVAGRLLALQGDVEFRKALAFADRQHNNTLRAEREGRRGGSDGSNGAGSRRGDQPGGCVCVIS